MSITRRSLLKGAALSPATASVAAEPQRASLAEILMTELAMKGVELEDIDVDNFLALDNDRVYCA
ncbi:MAG: twin-arginine translocation signal domain-containing protein [Pseudomonadota bacterium]